MAKIQSVWAIDIGQAALKALKLAPGGDAEHVTAEAFDFIEYPKLLSQPDADPEELVREALATFTDRNDLKGCRVAIAVPGQAGLVKFIKLPPVEKKRIPDIVKFEAKQQIPFALDEVVWDYQQIGDEDEEEGGDDEFTMAEVGLFAMKRDQIARAILPLTAAGIEVDVVQMAPIALYNYVTYDQIKGAGSKDSVVVLDIGADNTDLIITDGVRIWQRNVPIGGNHFTRALTKEMKLTFAKAEHLKRNATKAPDPRAIFTAMRGVFNDFASEVNRSIGFYSSINRTAKIRKVVGLGNGFKLPGLQKFLQQNLNHEVEKVDAFQRLEGDEVKAAPQFQDNLASFAVAYGLALQGAGLSPLRTNLLPPEIERVRLIRAKKPWALAASALIMLGLSSMFVLGDYRALARVSTPQYESAVGQATNVSKNGSTIKSGLDSAKSAWQAKYDEGKSLIIDPTNKGMWPAFLKTISNYLPDPVADYGLKPDDPKNEYLIEKLRVHVDRIMPVWRTDLAVDWFDELDPLYKRLMHPYDAENPPSGEGWVIQIVGHHYNPYPTTPDQQKLSPEDPKRYDLGPYEFLVRRVLRKLNSPQLRLYGVTHVALAWMNSDKNWTSDKGTMNNNLASRTVPLLDRASAPVEEGGAGEMGGMMGMMGPGMMGSGMMGRGGRMGGEMDPGMMGMGGMMGPGMMGMRGMRGGAGAGAQSDKDIRKLTRTDFLLQFVWVPPTPSDEDKDKTPEELLEARKAELQELTAKMIEAEKGKSVVTIPVEAEIEKASTKQSDEIDQAIDKALNEPAAPAGAAPKGGNPAAPADAAPAGAGAAGAAPTPKS